MKISHSGLTCYTIGYSDLPREVFLYFIKKVKIDTIVDVRSAPYSSYQPSYNKKELNIFLESNEIEYQYYGDRIGGRYTEPDLLFEDGAVNYEKVRKLPEFQKAIDELIDLIKQPSKVCLMCSEKKPQECHRFVLISRELQERGIQVKHIVPCIDFISNKKLEENLLNEMFDPAQSNLFNQPSQNLEELYLKLNRSIAYRADSSQNSNLNSSKTEPIEFSKPQSNTKKNDLLSSDNKTISSQNERTKKDSRDNIQDTLF